MWMGELEVENSVRRGQSVAVQARQTGVLSKGVTVKLGERVGRIQDVLRR